MFLEIIQVAREVALRDGAVATRYDASVSRTVHEREREIDCGLILLTMHVPVPIGPAPAWQINRAPHHYLNPIKWSDQIHCEREEMRAELEKQVTGLLKHPVIERSGLEQFERIQPLDRDLVESP
jgi:hypothetical protein